MNEEGKETKHTRTPAGRAAREAGARGARARVRDAELPALGQDAAVLRRRADQIDLVAVAGGDALDALEVEGAGRGLDVVGDGLGDGRVDGHVDELDLEGGRVAGDGGPGDLVVLGEVER